MRTIFLLFLLTLIAGEASAVELNKKFHQEFDVQPGDRLKLSHGDGTVHYEVWDKNVLDVGVVYEVDGESRGIAVKHDFDVEFDQTGSTVKITGKEVSRGIIRMEHFRKYRYVYTIRGPEFLDLDFRGDDGSVKIAGSAGDITCRTEDGNIRLSGLKNGEVQVTTDDGNIELKDCRVKSAELRNEDGDIELRSVDGRIRIRSDDGDISGQNICSPAVDIRLSDGDVDLDIKACNPQDIRIESDDGRVALTLDKNISARIEVETDDGKIREELDSAGDLRKKRHGLSAQLNEGEGLIRVTTRDGNVILREK